MTCMNHKWRDVSALSEYPKSQWICSECSERQRVKYHIITEASLAITMLGGGALIIGPMAYGDTQDYTIGDERHVVHRRWLN